MVHVKPWAKRLVHRAERYTSERTLCGEPGPFEYTAKPKAGLECQKCKRAEREANRGTR